MSKSLLINCVNGSKCSNIDGGINPSTVPCGCGVGRVQGKAVWGTVLGGRGRGLKHFKMITRTGCTIVEIYVKDRKER